MSGLPGNGELRIGSVALPAGKQIAAPAGRGAGARIRPGMTRGYEDDDEDGELAAMIAPFSGQFPGLAPAVAS